MKVIIIGGKGTAVDIGEQIVNAREHFNANVELLGWAVDDESLGPEINGYPVLCKPRELVEKYDDPEIKLIFSLYRADKMEERVNLLKSYGIAPSRFANFVHPLAYVSKSVTLGVGNVVLSFAGIFPNVRMGNHNILYPRSFIGHDTRVGDNNFFVGAGVGSETVIGNGVFMGMNSTITGNVTIGDYAFVGMCSNVIKSVEPRQMVFGNPARSVPRPV
jgi:sugar O-acyltransferase (sialic acid O-acetyltransferase NeuD family)